jgi:hypothetical protein
MMQQVRRGGDVGEFASLISHLALGLCGLGAGRAAGGGTGHDAAGEAGVW